MYVAYDTNRWTLHVSHMSQLVRAIAGAVAVGELPVVIAGYVTAFGVHQQTVAPEIC